MFKLQLPTPYPTFGSYMKQFGKNLIYASPALIIIALIGWFLDVVLYAAVEADN